MKRDPEVREIREYLYLGSSLRYLLDSAVGWKVHGEQYILGNLESVFWALERYHLPRSMEAAEPLRRQREGLQASNPAHRLTKSEAEHLRQNTAALRRVIREELGEQQVVAVEAGAVPASDLLTDLEQVLGEKVYSRIPDPSRRDIEEGCRSLALGNATSGAFLFLRGLGRLVQTFHKDWTGSEREGVADWGVLVDDLVARPPPPPADLMRTLVFLRKHYRVLVQSSETVYERTDVEELLPLAREAMVRMLEMMEDDRP